MSPKKPTQRPGKPQPLPSTKPPTGNPMPPPVPPKDTPQKPSSTPSAPQVPAKTPPSLPPKTAPPVPSKTTNPTPSASKAPTKTPPSLIPKLAPPIPRHTPNPPRPNTPHPAQAEHDDANNNHSADSSAADHAAAAASLARLAALRERLPRAVRRTMGAPPLRYIDSATLPADRPAMHPHVVELSSFAAADKTGLTAADGVATLLYYYQLGNLREFLAREKFKKFEWTRCLVATRGLPEEKERMLSVIRTNDDVVFGISNRLKYTKAVMYEVQKDGAWKPKTATHEKYGAEWNNTDEGINEVGRELAVHVIMWKKWERCRLVRMSVYKSTSDKDPRQCSRNGACQGGHEDAAAAEVAAGEKTEAPPAEKEEVAKGDTTKTVDEAQKSK